MTATPKRDETVDSYEYFGDPIFEYSLAQGIDDGFLAPYRVRRVVLSPDAHGWAPTQGQLDLFGNDDPRGALHDEGLRAGRVAADPHRGGRQAPDGVPAPHRSVGEDHRVLRGSGARRPDASRPPQRQRRPDEGTPELRRAHRQRRGRHRQGAPQRLRRHGEGRPGDRHDVGDAVDRRRPPDRSQHRAVPARRVDGDVQADDRTRHPLVPRRGQAVVRHHRLLGCDSAVRATPSSTGRPNASTKRRSTTKATSSTSPSSKNPNRLRPGGDGSVDPDDLDHEPRAKFYVDDAEVWVTAEAIYHLDPETQRLRLVEYRDFVTETVRALYPDPKALRGAWSHRVGREEVSNSAGGARHRPRGTPRANGHGRPPTRSTCSSTSRGTSHSLLAPTEPGA